MFEIKTEKLENYEKQLTKQIELALEKIEEIKRASGKGWGDIAMPKLVKVKGAQSELERNAIAINDKIASINRMREFCNANKNCENYISVHNDDIYTICYEKNRITTEEGLNSLNCEIYMIGSDCASGAQENFNQNSVVARADIDLQLNESGKSWGQLNSCYTKESYRGQGMAKAILAHLLELIKRLQPMLERKGFMRISYVVGVVANFENNVSQKELCEIYKKCDFKIEGNQCYYVFEN